MLFNKKRYKAREPPVPDFEIRKHSKFGGYYKC